jgi:nicotinamidase-related amidase
MEFPPDWLSSRRAREGTTARSADFSIARGKKPASMPSQSRQRDIALLIVDMVSEYQFPDAERILKGARKAARKIVRLKQRAHAAKVPVIYVNDTAGKWESDQKAFVQRCLKPTARGRDVVELIAPSPHDYFMFKPKHSAFFDTPLHTLLQQLKISKLILTGVTSHQCVLFTAMDAHVREYGLIIPPDCMGAPSATDSKHALYVFSHALNAKITTSDRLRF